MKTMKYANPEEHPEHVNKKQSFIAVQLACLLYVGFCALLWMVVEKFWPDFFSPFEWSRGIQGTLYASTMAFWPLFVYSAAMACLSLLNLVQAVKTGTTDEGHLILDSVISTLAGVWEEIGYRCVFILLAMISILVTNFFWSWFAFVLAIFALLGSIHLTLKNNFDFVSMLFGGILCFASIALIYFTWNLNDPVFWIYQNVIFPVLNWISFQHLTPILYYPHAPFLFIAGAVFANSKFKNGHKYQGLIGVLNSWAVGFVLLYAMLYYGLMTAIVVHVVYDLEFASIRYMGRKIGLAS
jgi:hypothetical protein